MYTHHVSVARVWLPKTQPAPDSSQRNFCRGAFFGVLFSVPIWAAIAWGIYELVR